MPFKLYEGQKTNKYMVYPTNLEGATGAGKGN